MEKLLTIEDVANLTGLSVPGIYGLSHKHLIPVVRISSRCIRFRASDIASWLESKSTPVNAVTEARKEHVFKKRPGRPRKNSVANNYVNSIVESAKKEVTA